jgi:chromosome segregation ATPase
MRRENEAKAAHASLGTKLKAAEAAAADGAKEVDRLSGEISKLRGEVESQKALFNDSEADMKKLVDGLNAADDALAEAKQEAQEAKEKAKETETESLFFLGEMQVAVSEAEKKITTLSKTVTSRDMKLAQMTAEVKALKAAVRQREEKLEAADASHAKTMEDAVTSLKRAHAEELAAAKGEVEGLSNMLEMENDQLRQNLDEKRAKLSRLQADLGNAMEKNKMFMERCERARAAQTIAEETAAEAERRREEVVFMLRRAEEVHTQNVNATEKVHKLQVEELEDAVTKEKARANALGRAMWERGMRRGYDAGADAPQGDDRCRGADQLLEASRERRGEAGGDSTTVVHGSRPGGGGVPRARKLTQDPGARGELGEEKHRKRSGLAVRREIGRADAGDDDAADARQGEQ